MTTRVKIFLLWLLALAIPVQGFAAAVQIGCAPTHQSQALHEVVAPVSTMAEHHHAGHNMNGIQMDADASASAAAPATTAAADHSSPHQQHQHNSSSASCSSCSVCTIGAILPLALDRLINLPVSATIHVALTQHGFVGYTPENPERPPSQHV